jgi:hypothetical protein
VLIVEREPLQWAVVKTLRASRAWVADEAGATRVAPWTFTGTRTRAGKLPVLAPTTTGLVSLALLVFAPTVVAAVDTPTPCVLGVHCGRRTRLCHYSDASERQRGQATNRATAS